MAAAPPLNQVPMKLPTGHLGEYHIAVWRYHIYELSLWHPVPMESHGFLEDDQSDRRMCAPAEQHQRRSGDPFYSQKDVGLAPGSRAWTPAGSSKWKHVKNLEANHA